jgi:HK97 family phage portal protein
MISRLRQIAADYRAGREARSASAAASLKTPAELMAALYGTTRSGAAVNAETAFNVSTVAACVNVLAQSLAMLPLKVYRRGPSGAEEATDHPLSPLLKRKPGRAQTSYQWRAWCQTCLGIGGNGYSRIYHNAYSEIERIEPIKACHVDPRLLDTGDLVYRVRGEARDLAAFEVLHLRGLSTDGYLGRSPLHDMRESIGLAITAQTFAASTFANGNRQPGIFKGPPTWNREKAQEFLAYLQSTYAGATAGGKPFTIYGGMDWQSAGFSNQDAELLLTRKFEVEEIARVYRVPLTLLQSMEKSTSFGTGIAELSRGFVTYTLTPWLVNWEHEMEDKLLSEAEKAAGMSIKFNVAALLRGSPLEQAQKAEIERRARLRSVNEYREDQDWNRFQDPGADDPAWPLNAQESGQKSATKEPADPAEPPDLEDPEDPAKPDLPAK